MDYYFWNDRTEVFADITVKPQIEVSLLGSSLLDFPQKGKDVIVHATLNYIAKYECASSYLEVIGAHNKDSYLILPECKLSGRFAFAMWFTGIHTNDFVITVGDIILRFFWKNILFIQGWIELA